MREMSDCWLFAFAVAVTSCVQHAGVNAASTSDASEAASTGYDSPEAQAARDP
jgi:hypothetical protein